MPDSVTMIALPSPFILMPGQRLNIGPLNIQPTDQLANIVLAYFPLLA